MAATTVQLLDAAIAKVDGMLGRAAAAPAAPTAAKHPQPQPKQPQPQPKQPAPAQAAGDAPELHGHWAKVLVRVARVLEVEAVQNSDKLYKLKVDCGSEVRQVCAGLRQFIPADELKGKLVVAVCNLKPAKLAGVASEAMLLAATGGPQTVRMIEPPPASQPGEQVHMEGGAPSTDTPKQLKSEVWKAVAGALRVAGGRKAALDGVPLVVSGRGPVTVPECIPEGAEIR